MISMDIERPSISMKGYKSEDSYLFFDFLKYMYILFDQSTEENRVLFYNSLDYLSAIGVRPSAVLEKDIASVSPDSIFASLIALSSVKNQIVASYPESKVSKIKTLEFQAKKNTVYKKTLDLIYNTANQTQQINQKTSQILAYIQYNDDRYKPEAVDAYRKFAADIKLIQEKVYKVEFTLLNQFQRKQEMDFADYERELLEGQSKTQIEIGARYYLIDQFKAEKLVLDQRIAQLTRDYENQQLLVSQLRSEGESRALEFEKRILEITTKNSIALDENRLLLSQFYAAQGSEEYLYKEVENLFSEIYNLTTELAEKNKYITTNANDKLILERRLKQNQYEIEYLTRRIEQLQNVDLERYKYTQENVQLMELEISNLQNDLGSLRGDLTQSYLKLNITETEKERQKEYLEIQIVELQDYIRYMEVRYEELKKIEEINNLQDQKRMQDMYTLQQERVQLMEETEALRYRFDQTVEENSRKELIYAARYEEYVQELTQYIYDFRRKFEDQENLISYYEKKITQQNEELNKMYQTESQLQAYLLQYRTQNQINLVQEQQTQIRIQYLYRAIELVNQIANESDFSRQRALVEELEKLNVGNLEAFYNVSFAPVVYGYAAQTDPVTFYSSTIYELESQIDTYNTLLESLRTQIYFYRDSYQYYTTLLADLQDLRNELNMDERELNQIRIYSRLTYSTSDVYVIRNNILNLQNKMRRNLQDEYNETLEQLRYELQAVNVERRYVEEQVYYFYTEISDMSLSVDESAQNRYNYLYERITELELEKIRFKEGRDPDSIKEILKRKITDLQKTNPVVLQQITDVLRQQNRRNAQLRNISLNLLRNIKPEDLITYIDNLVPYLLNLNPLNAHNIVNQSYFFLFRKRPRQFISNEPSKLFEEEEIQDIKYRLSQSVVLERGKNLIFSSQQIGLSDDVRKKQFGRDPLIPLNPISVFDRNNDDSFDESELLRLLNLTEYLDNQNQFLRGASNILNRDPSFNVLEEIKEESNEKLRFNIPAGGDGGDGGGGFPGYNQNRERKKKIRKERYKMSKTYMAAGGGGGDSEPSDFGGGDDDDDPEDGDSDFDYVEDDEELEDEQIIVNQQGDTEILDSFGEDENQRELDRIAQVDREITNLLVNLFNPDRFPGDGGGGGDDGNGSLYSWGEGSSGTYFNQNYSRVGGARNNETNLLEIEAALKVLIEMYKKERKDKQKRTALPVLRVMLKTVINYKRSDSQKERARFDDVRLISKAI